MFDNLYNKLVTVEYNGNKYKLRLNYNPISDCINFSYANISVTFAGGLTPNGLKPAILLDIKKKLQNMLDDPSSSKQYNTQDTNNFYNTISDILTDKNTMVTVSHLSTKPIEIGDRFDYMNIHLVASDRIPGCTTPCEALWERRWADTPLVKADLFHYVIYKSDALLADKGPLKIVGLDAFTIQGKSVLALSLRADGEKHNVLDVLDPGFFMRIKEIR